MKRYNQIDDMLFNPLEGHFRRSQIYINYRGSEYLANSLWHGIKDYLLPLQYNTKYDYF